MSPIPSDSQHGCGPWSGKPHVVGSFSAPSSWVRSPARMDDRSIFPRRDIGLIVDQRPPPGWGPRMPWCRVSLSIAGLDELLHIYRVYLPTRSDHIHRRLIMVAQRNPYEFPAVRAFATELTAWREEAGMSKTEFAETLGYTP